MNMEMVVEVDLANCMHVKLNQEIAVKFVQLIIAKHGITRDLEEAKRVVENFEEYYGILRRRLMDYLVVPKDIAESLRGRTVVHKIKLMKEGDKNIVEFVLDRRVSRELVVECLKDLGYSDVVFKQARF